MIAVGQSIGNYTLTAKLGEGGMGVVYLAEHPIIGRRVAMKVVHPELLRKPEVVSRFITEAKSVNQIGNEHIVDIHDFGTTADGEFYFVMEFLHGEALADCLKRVGPLDANRALSIAAQVADALGASHQHHIVHRDLKPENIFLITKGRVADFVKVLDFGLAKLTTGDSRVSHKTRPGSVMGTTYYMAPEQCEGTTSIDHRADIYSLGVILFEMVTGTVPFSGEGYGEIIVKHITAAVPSPRVINPRVSPSIEAVIVRALAKRREDRFQTMEEFAAALFDPDGFAAGALASGSPTVRGIPAAFVRAAQVSPARPSESVISGQAIFGDPDQNAGARSAPMPPTFRQAAGEETNADQSYHVTKPRRTRLIAAMVAAATVAGLASYYFTLRRPAEAPPQPPTIVVPEPVIPKKAKLDFRSDPPGAVVLRRDTNEQLGITPFAIELPVATAPVDFVFKKEGFRDKVESFIPTASGQGAVGLATNPPPSPETSLPQGEPKPADKPRPKASLRDRPAPGGIHKRVVRAMDEDGTLAPSF